MSSRASDHVQLRGTSFALVSAALFGLSTPLAKMLLPRSGPLMMAALLYLGAGVGLSFVMWFRSWHSAGRASPREAAIRRADLWLLAAIIISGGVMGPVLMLTGLARLSGMAASLLLNLEAPFTILIAVAFLREHLGRRELAAAALIILGAVVLGYTPGDIRADWLGIAAVTGACLAWGIDNNLTQRLSLRDPVVIGSGKAMGAGVCTLAIAFAAGDHLPPPVIIGLTLALGLISYGISIVLAVYAMRALGAARQAVFFATAPFMGGVAAIPLLGEHPGIAEALAAILMVAGTVFLLRARHIHVHAHNELEHDHAHVHGMHHAHTHLDSHGEPHAHPHRHPPLVHDHPHVSDTHHRHPH